jgi:hypothetical protein
LAQAGTLAVDSVIDGRPGIQEREASPLLRRHGTARRADWLRSRVRRSAIGKKTPADDISSDCSGREMLQLLVEPLESAAEAFGMMLRNEARFRMVLVIGI